ncbi:DUF502 domain-containing protein [Chloroflexota bacterium]
MVHILAIAAELYYYLKDMVINTIRSIFFSIVNSRVVPRSRERINDFNHAKTPGKGTNDYESPDFMGKYGFRERVAAASKAGARTVFGVSRKYAGLAHAKSQDGIRTSKVVVLTGSQQLPGVLKRRFLAGLKVVIPVGITLGILVWIFVKIDNLLQPAISYALGRAIPGLGFGMVIFVILIAGVIVSNVTGRKLIYYAESLLSKMPIVRLLYKGIKQITDSFSFDNSERFIQVVLVEFPKKGMMTVGFITNETKSESGTTYLNVFIPTAPNPTSGFLQIIKEEEVIRTEISPDDALKMIVSAGKVSATDIITALNKNMPGVKDLEAIIKDQAICINHGDTLD